MAKKSFAQLLKEADEAKDALKAQPDFEGEEGAPKGKGKDADLDLGLDDEDDEPKDPDAVSDDELKDQPSGKGDYSADDLREIIDYVYDILDREDDGLMNDSVGEIGLDLIYDYADTMPQSLLNQLVDDLKGIFEIEDTLLEAIVNEDAAFLKKKGPAAKAAAKAAKKHYCKNKKITKSDAENWRNSERGQAIIALHNKIQKKLKKKKGVRLKDAKPAEVEM